MQLEDVTVAIRPRNPWEAMDLGFSLIRTWWKAIYLPWFAVVLPVFAALTIALRDHLWIAGIVLWWLKPVFDRIVLHVLSRAVFGNTPAMGDTLRAIPALLKTGIVAHLTFVRLSPSRAFNLPVWQLEALRGKERRERQRVLGGGHATWLLLTCINLEFVISISLIGIAFMLIPPSVEAGFIFSVFTDDGSWGTQFASNFAYLLTLSLIEPLYVAAGFTLYINRRTELEAWDIELAFRRMSKRLKEYAGTAAMLTVLLLIPLTALMPQTSVAAQGERLPATESSTVIERILAQPDFGIEKEIETWALKEAEEDEEDKDEADWLRNLIQLTATVLEALLWIALGIGIVLLFVYRERWLGFIARAPHKAPGYTPPPTLFGLDITPESLPEDIPAEALKLWQAGQHRQAIGLLYRGSLMVLTTRKQVELRASHTEGDVLTLAQHHLDNAAADYQSRLTRCWQDIAYAHRPPDTQRAQALCSDWRQFFAVNDDAESSQGTTA